MSPVSRNDAETIQRTLILAQRAADNAMAEAEAKARELVEESEAKAQTLVSDAEANARRIHDEEMRQHEAEIAALLARRDRLQADADALETYANDYRDRVRGRDRVRPRQARRHDRAALTTSARSTTSTARRRDYSTTSR